MSSTDIELAVAIEIRAAELGIDAPRLSDHVYSSSELSGWAIHYWYQYGLAKDRQRAPESPSELAGWLAREIYLANASL